MWSEAFYVGYIFCRKRFLVGNVLFKKLLVGKHLAEKRFEGNFF